MKTRLLIIIGIALMIASFSLPVSAFSQTDEPDPKKHIPILKQSKSGISNQDVVCHNNLFLVIKKSTDIPACIKLEPKEVKKFGISMHRLPYVLPATSQNHQWTSCHSHL